MCPSTMDKEILVPYATSPPANRNFFRSKYVIICFIVCVVFLLCCIMLSILLFETRSYFPVFKVCTDSSTVTTSFDGKIETHTASTETAKLTTASIPSSCTDVADNEKFDCYPDAPVTEEQCLKRGCCFHVYPHTSESLNYTYFPPLGVPYCYYPSDYTGYLVGIVEPHEYGITASLTRKIPSGFPNDVMNITLSVQHIDDTTLRIRFTDSDKERFEVPVIEDIVGKAVPRNEWLYEVVLTGSILSIVRGSSKTKVFSTDLQQLVYSDQFIQLSTRLPSRYIYGLGEQYDHLLRSVNWTRTTLFNNDIGPIPNTNLYGTHPFYMVIENDSNVHGVFLLNSNAMDHILQPTPALTFRTIGGILDFFVFLGPTASNVVEQYTQVVGRPFMPPYWSLGFHLCKYGYGSLNETKKVWQRTRDAGIPFDTQWNDIDYMDKHNDFTYDKDNFTELPEFVKELHEEGMHYVIIIDPGISNAEPAGTYSPYDDGLDYDIFVRNSTGDIFIGKVWNDVSTVFPDFSHPNATTYWTQQFKKFHDIVPFDGAWIDMNEPSNFYNGTIDGCPDIPLEDPQYVPGGYQPLRTKTLCMSAKHHKTVHYNEHNLYAYREAVSSNFAMRNITGKREFVISRASFSGLGHYSGHWSGDIASTWEDMRYSVIDLLNFMMFGIPMMGSDICGFNGNTEEKLCARWQALGAFYPFSRNHNDKGKRDQDPVALGELVVNATRNTLFTRYELLPFLYTLFYESHVYGTTVVRPLFFEFTDDEKTYGIEEQFLWGSSLMVIPVLYEGAMHVTAYFPKAVWYDYYTGERMNVSGTSVTLDAPYDSINLALRGGYVVSKQHANTTTTASRLNKFTLLIALNEDGDAHGQLFWDDGETIGTVDTKAYNLIKFMVQNNTLTSEVLEHGYDTKMELDIITVYGLNSPPENVTINGNPAEHEFDSYKCLTVHADVSLLQVFELRWF